MATNFDVPRTSEDDQFDDSARTLNPARTATKGSAIDAIDQLEAEDLLELPGADPSDEELSVRVLPKQQDEFTCSSCFLVHHLSRLARIMNQDQICRDCD
ncbi:DUF4193 domain-containing protein [Kitasatospora herbaricolor]|uniref:DUF4193 domain-containing protein n=1 Tax=Kitasatospora herbaricolor TaxID=68217 RepID=UPI0036DF3C61